MIHSQHFDVYILSCEPDGGVYHYKMNDSGKCVLSSKYTLDRPMYAVIDNNKMFVVLRQPCDDNSDSGVVTFDVLKDGSLAQNDGIVSTKGEVACHILSSAGKLYCTNYISGSVILLPDKLVCHSGCGVNPVRQSSPHTHCVISSPDEKYVLVTDLGLDSIFVYDKNLELKSKAMVPGGHGARHILFSDDGKYLYCANELASTLSVFEYNDGKLTLIDTKSVLPEDFKGESTASAIRSRDGFVFVSNRGHDSISCMKFDGQTLSLQYTVDCGGQTPRDFNFAGDFLLSANQDSNNVTVFGYSCGKLQKIADEIKIDSPLCILEG